MNKQEYLAQLSYEYDGEWTSIAKAIKKQIQPSFHHINENYLTIFDTNYPKAFLSLRYPPWVIFYAGNLELLNQPKMTIVGSRDICPYGKKVTEEIVTELSKKYVIVSGLAKGVDGIAHQTAMKQGHTIGVIGNGLDIPYPICNKELYQQMKQKQLILSEYPAKTPPKKYHFPWRNRLIAALGDACIVTQATVRSGTMITVNEALELSKEIYCIPYPYEQEVGEGNNLLISQGAQILYSLEQLQQTFRIK